MSLGTRARHWAGRFVGWAFERAGGPPPGLLPGRVDRALDARPVLVVLLQEADAETVGSTAHDLAGLLESGGPRSVLVVDQPHFAAARRQGVVCDYVLPEKAWRERGYAGTYEVYLDAQLDRLRRDLGARSWITLPPGGSRAMEAEMFRALMQPARSPGRLGRLLVRLERKVDHPSGGW